MPSTLQTLIDAIPTAHDGDVIASTYHNTLRAAMVELVNQLNAGLGGATFTITCPPNFAQNATGPNWSQNDGIASKATGIAAVNGWIPVLLPNAVRIDSMIVYGHLTGTAPASMHVKLIRQSIASGNVQVLVDMQLKNETGVFKETLPVDVTSATPTQLAGYKLVDVSQYSYLITAAVTGGSGAAIDIYNIQIQCSRL